MPSRLKEFMVDEYVRQFTGSTYFFFTSYLGLKSQETVDIRDKVRNIKQKARVVKNNVAAVAFEKIGIKGAANFLTDDTLVVFGQDPVAIAKLLEEALKTYPKLKMHGAYMEGELLDAKAAIAVAKFPSLPELRSMIAGMIGGPGRKLATAISSGAQRIVNALKGLEDKLKAPESSETAQGTQAQG